VARRWCFRNDKRAHFDITEAVRFAKQADDRPTRAILGDSRPPRQEERRVYLYEKQLLLVTFPVSGLGVSRATTMFPLYPSFFLLLLLGTTTTRAQTCNNYGSSSSSSACICPPGFVNASSDCSLPVCGGSLGQAGLAGIAVPRTSAGFGNTSSPVCSCSSGWTGPGCTGTFRSGRLSVLGLKFLDCILCER
jgi:hypothetical protein